MRIDVAPHPLLDAAAFVTRLPVTVAELPAWGLDPTAEPPADRTIAPPGLPVDDAVRTAVRALLRHGGYKPSGRSKPASEYLVGARAEGRFPSINPLVDVCNLVSLHSGLPISVVDLDLVRGDLRLALCAGGTQYVFNPSGQTIDASGLLALMDADGPAGTPVKDAQRTKTHAGTRNTLSIVWGTRELPGRAARATAWYRALTERVMAAATEDVELAA
ncbi:MAG TPA: phenylalanine--tRNA ligase beta subunit-related protein [Kofleriaceae bacterium]|nr:phenylalanine--tRNA ligase beta subunit-related protein [Kofleriaceae bacterium]